MDGTSIRHFPSTQPVAAGTRVLNLESMLASQREAQKTEIANVIMRLKQERDQAFKELEEKESLLKAGEISQDSAYVQELRSRMGAKDLVLHWIEEAIPCASPLLHYFITSDFRLIYHQLCNIKSIQTLTEMIDKINKDLEKENIEFGKASSDMDNLKLALTQASAGNLIDRKQQIKFQMATLFRKVQQRERRIIMLSSRMTSLTLIKENLENSRESEPDFVVLNQIAKTTQPHLIEKIVRERERGISKVMGRIQANNDRKIEHQLDTEEMENSELYQTMTSQMFKDSRLQEIFDTCESRGKRMVGVREYNEYPLDNLDDDSSSSNNHPPPPKNDPPPPPNGGIAIPLVSNIN